MKFTFKCNVSKGTYIRSLINDICNKLNVIGTMSNLKRTKQGKFLLEDSIKIDDISEDKRAEIIEDSILTLRKKFGEGSIKRGRNVKK